MSDEPKRRVNVWIVFAAAVALLGVAAKLRDWKLVLGGAILLLLGIATLVLNRIPPRR
jgi:hypothetical protein